MEEYQRRVLIEYAELAEKRTKLNAFLGCTSSAQIEPQGRGMLEEQIDVMDTYASILSRRLTSFGINVGDAIKELEDRTTPTEAVKLISELSDRNDDATYRAAVKEIVAAVR